MLFHVFNFRVLLDNENLSLGLVSLPADFHMLLQHLQSKASATAFRARYSFLLLFREFSRELTTRQFHIDCSVGRWLLLR
jgi:hypothetical protein